MNSRFLIDTNIIIALFDNEYAVQQHLVEDIEVFISAIALGKMYYEAYKSTRVKENIAGIDEFASRSAVLACDSETAQWYGQIKDGLRKKKATSALKMTSGLQP